MNIFPCDVKINTFKIRVRNRVYNTFTTISLDFLFILRYQHQVLNPMSLSKDNILSPYWFNWAIKPWNTAHQTPLPPQKCFWHRFIFVISALQYNIVLRETYKFKIQKYYCWHSVNEYMTSVRSLLLHKSTYKIKNHKYVLWDGDTISK